MFPLAIMHRELFFFFILRSILIKHCYFFTREETFSRGHRSQKACTSGKKLYGKKQYFRKENKHDLWKKDGLFVLSFLIVLQFIITRQAQEVREDVFIWERPHVSSFVNRRQFTLIANTQGRKQRQGGGEKFPLSKRNCALVIKGSKFQPHITVLLYSKF